VDRIVYAEEEALRRAFLWSEPRTPDKAGVFGLFGTRYQVGPGLARKRVDVRFDPEHLAEVEVWHQGRFVERVRPFQVQPHRRPRPEDDAEASATAPKPGPKPAPTADWLGHLVRTRRQDALVHHPRALVQAHADQRAQADQAFLDLLSHRLDPAVVDAATVHTWLDRFGPPVFLPSSPSRRSADPCLNDAFRAPFLLPWTSLSGQHPLSPALDEPTPLGNTHPHGGKGLWKFLSTPIRSISGARQDCEMSRVSR